MGVTSAERIDDGDSKLDCVFYALSDPTRRAIVSRLTVGEATVTEIAAPFDMSLPGVSKHIAVLERAGLVRRWRTGRSRRCALAGDAMQHATSWLESRTLFWNETLERLAAFVEAGEDEP